MKNISFGMTKILFVLIRGVLEKKCAPKGPIQFFGCRQTVYVDSGCKGITIIIINHLYLHL